MTSAQDYVFTKCDGTGCHVKYGCHRFTNSYSGTKHPEVSGNDVVRDNEGVCTGYVQNLKLVS